MKNKNVTGLLHSVGGILLLAFITLMTFQLSAQTPIGIFDSHEDVGNPRLKGSAVYNPEDQTYTVSSAGKNMWATDDQFHFLWKEDQRRFYNKGYRTVCRKRNGPSQEDRDHRA